MLLSVILSLAFVNICLAHSAGDCVCFNANGVNIRATACGNWVGTGNNGDCFSATGLTTSCSLGGTLYNWWQFDYNGGTAWSVINFMSIQPSSQCHPQGPPSSGCGLVQIVSRAEWAARSPVSTTPLGQVAMQFVHHSAGGRCYNQFDCAAAVRGIQNYHMDGNNWDDIGYNFLIGDDGRAYEGRGWYVRGAHAGTNYNGVAIGICIMGDFTSQMPSQAALDALDNLMGCGVSKNVAYPYTIHGHRDASATSCPGDTFFPYVAALPGYGGDL